MSTQDDMIRAMRKGTRFCGFGFNVYYERGKFCTLDGGIVRRVTPEVAVSAALNVFGKENPCKP